MEIGSAALNILVECWDGHLTPPEVASLADRASRARDPNMVRAAAELALSCLPHAHALNPNEIQRALVQCKEQVPLRPPSAPVEDGEGAPPPPPPPGARSPVPPLPRSVPLANRAGAQDGRTPLTVIQALLSTRLQHEDLFFWFGFQ